MGSGLGLGLGIGLGLRLCLGVRVEVLVRVRSGRVYRARAVRRATGAMRHSRAAPTAAALSKERPNV